MGIVTWSAIHQNVIDVWICVSHSLINGCLIMFILKGPEVGHCLVIVHTEGAPPTAYHLIRKNKNMCAVFLILLDCYC